MLVTFEGIDGIGKTYYSRKFVTALQIKYGKAKVILTHEPFGFPEIQKILFTHPLDKKTELLLFLALRNEHYLNIIRPALKCQTIVVCDRYIDSTVAYQGYGDSIPLHLVDYLNNFIIEQHFPILTFILDGEIECVKRQNQINKFERRNDIYFNNVRYGFQQIAKKNPERCHLINVNSSDFHEEIFLNIFQEVIDAQ